jgi:adenylosuccinate synthase
LALRVKFEVNTVSPTGEFYRAVSVKIVELPSVDKVTVSYMKLGEKLAPFIQNTSKLVYQAIKNNQNVLIEGAQGTLLDIDHGTYPYVTSSSSIAGGATTGIGIGPTALA